jgi:RimJ/RimL family protein N-acetyltransferase
MRSPSVPAPAGTVVRAADRPGLTVPSVLLRPLAAGDTGTVERVFAGLSEKSRLMRFLAPVARLSDRFLHHLTDVDQDRHGCWVAVVDGTPVGLGRYVVTRDDPTVAEIAVEVADAVQNRGLGSLLLDVISVAAADVGVTRLLWVLDPANSRVHRRARRLGGRFAVEDGVLTARTGLPVVRGLDTAALLGLARSARGGARPVAGLPPVPAAPPPRSEPPVRFRRPPARSARRRAHPLSRKDSHDAAGRHE